MSRSKLHWSWFCDNPPGKYNGAQRKDVVRFQLPACAVSLTYYQNGKPQEYETIRHSRDCHLEFIKSQTVKL